MIPRFGTSPDVHCHYTPRPGAYVIARRGDGVLVTFQQAPLPEFQLPGGGVDPGESLIQAAHRETMEETGWRIANLRRLGCFRRFVFMPEYNMFAEKICHVLTARAVLKISAPTEPGHSAVWLPIDEAIDVVANTGDSHFLRLVASLKRNP